MYSLCSLLLTIHSEEATMGIALDYEAGKGERLLGLCIQGKNGENGISSRSTRAVQPVRQSYVDIFDYPCVRSILIDCITVQRSCYLSLRKDYTSLLTEFKLPWHCPFGSSMWGKQTPRFWWTQEWLYNWLWSMKCGGDVFWQFRFSSSAMRWTISQVSGYSSPCA